MINLDLTPAVSASNHIVKKSSLKNVMDTGLAPGNNNSTHSLTFRTDHSKSALSHLQTTKTVDF